MIQSYDINIQTAKHGEWSEVYKNEYEAVNLLGSLQSGYQTRLHRVACLSRPLGAYPSPLHGSQMNNPTTTYTSQHQSQVNNTGNICLTAGWVLY